MYLTEFNPKNLKMSDISKKVTRVKAFIINSKKEILIATSNGGCQLPGGHLEEAEENKQGLIREIREETGIELVSSEVSEPIYEIRYLKENYKNNGINRMSNVIYFIVKTDKRVDLQNISLTENEANNNYTPNYIHLSDFKKYVSSFLFEEQIDINKSIISEILEVFEKIENSFI